MHIIIPINLITVFDYINLVTHDKMRIGQSYAKRRRFNVLLMIMTHIIDC